ncbi:CDK5 regulatory subunit-associated protein 1-like [Mizuhopecten yessoensis]|uniref:CDK5 regulatory subunit-associated protein 1 n=1 Tax=Mizuhopecten yessoensis TaxID=6573 RepID=A0A210QJX1_MIZYE|nr:CDK5 regulatory subunit-associated protein 1-like [Mizuhopecten yessoensis]OWF49045.1 CDK5 regulatory subunit-associated protein 1 [Mizuhopecten yessoensis]
MSTSLNTRLLQRLLRRNLGVSTCVCKKDSTRYLATSKHVCSSDIDKPSPSKNPGTLRDRLIDNPLPFKSFLTGAAHNDYVSTYTEEVPYAPIQIHEKARKVYFETYGCQMNVNDTEIAMAILEKNGFEMTTNVQAADVLFMMTCSIREGAEQKIWKRLEYYKSLKKKRSSMKIGILGCMAENLKKKIIEKDKLVDIVCGPDAYKDLPRLLDVTSTGQAAVNVMLSFDETYADVMPVRVNKDSPSAFVSIMRGCDNMCTYCIVPFTRGRERSRPIASIVEEIQTLSDQGLKEITLLGQNVNSYLDKSESKFYGGLSADAHTKNSSGFKTVYKPKVGGRRFSDLLDAVSRVDPSIRIRFTSPHPKDFPDEVLYLIRDRANVCNHIHLPAQSGSTSVLQAMRRGYTRESYLELVHHIWDIIPDVSLSSDFIAGFCGETEADHVDTLSLMEIVHYNFAYMFPYSMRNKTHAHHKLKDDVPDDVKKRRHLEIAKTFRKGALMRNQAQIGQKQLVLVESVSKRSTDDMAGRNDGNTKVILVGSGTTAVNGLNLKPGDYVVAEIASCSSQVLHGLPLYTCSIQDFYRSEHSCQGNNNQQHTAVAS